MNAVIYARYSSDNQREESIEGQLRECKEYADKNAPAGRFLERGRVPDGAPKRSSAELAEDLFGAPSPSGRLQRSRRRSASARGQGAGITQ